MEIILSTMENSVMEMLVVAQTANYYAGMVSLMLVRSVITRKKLAASTARFNLPISARTP